MSEADYTGTGPDALSLVRHYRSSWGGTTPRGLPLDPGLSRVWTHNHAVSIKREGTAGAAGSSAKVMFGDGSVRAFDWQTGSSSWLAANSADILTANGAGLQYKRLDDDSLWQFDAVGKLLTVAQRNGWVNTYAYGTTATSSTIAPPPSLATFAPSPAVTEYRYVYDGVTGPWSTVPLTACQGWGAAYPVTYPGYSISTPGVTGTNCRYVPHYPNGSVGSEGSISAATRVTPGSCPVGSTPTGVSCIPNLLISVSNQFGRSLNFAYNAASQLVSVTASDGQVTSYTYDSTTAAARLTTVTYPGSVSGTVSKTYLYENTDFPRLVTGIVDETGNRLATIAYDSLGRATSSGYAGGADLYSVSYAAPGAATVTDPLGTQRTYHYATAKGKLAVTSADKPSGTGAPFAASRVQDANGFVTQETDFLGVNTLFTWDINRRLPLTTTEAAALPEARTTTTTWHSTFRLPTLVTEAGRTTAYTYDSLGNTLTATVTDTATSVARTTTWTYIASGNGQGQPGTRTDPNTGLTQFGYDAAGNLTSVTNPLGHVTTLAYDSAGRLTTRTEPTGLVTTYTYDNRSRLLTQTTGATGGLVTTFTYRSTGQVATATLPSGYAITYSYDNAQRLTGWADNRGAQGVYTLDAMGNRTQSQIKTSGGTVVWQLAQSINSLNRPASETAGTGGAIQTQSYGYNANADLTSQTNGLSQSTGYGLDGLKRITSVTDALSATASLAYNSLDSVTSATDFKGVATSYTRDALGNATQEAGNDAGTHTAQYDALGLPNQLTDALSQSTSITRDLLGRPTLLTFTGGRTTTLSYDLTGSTYNASGAPNASKGYLSKIEDSSGITTYQRDIFGRVTMKTQTLVQTAPNSTSQQVGYSYNSQGLVGTITYPSGGQLVHSYSAAGQLTGLSWNSTPLISSLTWTAAGQPAGWTWPFATSGGTNINATRTYDTAGRVTATELSGYGYDAAGRLTTLSQSLYSPSDSNPANSGITLGTTSWTVGYDATGRITSFNDAATSSTSGFTYDANGNRLTSSQSPCPAAGITSRSRTYSITTYTNRLASYSQSDVVSSSPVNSTTTFSINANGDTTGDGTRTYGFDVESRLVSTSTGTSPTVSTSRYSHNALGQRTFKTLPVTTSPTTADPGYAFVYDEDGTLIGEYGATGTASAGTTEYIWLPSPNGPIPVAAVINGTIFAVQADHLNTPRRLSNTSAQAVWQWKYSAFGDEQPTLAANRFADLAMNPNPGTTTIPPLTFNLRYPGQYADVESGLNYNYFRSYNSDTGSYTQADPIGLDGGWNRFGYVAANPLRRIDPSGLQAFPEDRPSGPAGLPNPSAAAQADLARRLTNIFCPPEPGCIELQWQMEELAGELRERHVSMTADAENLYCTRPIGKFSWIGHQIKFSNKQRQLQKLIEVAVGRGCAVSGEYIKLAAISPPSCPAR